MELDAFLDERLGGVGRCLAVDRAVLDLAVVHAPRLFGEFLADVIGVLDDVVAQLLELLAQLDLFLGDDRDRRLFRLRRWRRGGIAAARRAERGRHDGLFALGGAAVRTGHQPSRGLMVDVGRIVEPALEAMAGFAAERVADHAGPPTTCRWVGSAMGSRISKRRPCWSEAIRDRAAATSAGSMSANTMPGSMPPSARMRPQGSTTSECPNVSRPFSCLPPWTAAKTTHPFSIARARS